MSNHELPQGWVRTNLGDIAGRVTKGSTPTTYGFDYQPEGVRFIKVENVADGRIDLKSVKHFISEQANQNQKRSILQVNDVLFSIAGTIGETAIVEEKHLPANTNQAFAIISGFSETLSPKFLQLQLKSFVSAATKEKARGGAMFNISLGDIKDLAVVIAPSNEQKRIVDKIERLFSDLDEGEALLRQVQKQLATYRQSVLKAAVTGELTKDWREQNKRCLESGEALLQRILKSRRENWKGRGKYKEPLALNVSNLPKLPSGWDWASGDQLFIWSSGEFLPAKKIMAGDVPVYGGNGINGHHNESLIDYSTIVIGRVGAHCGNVHISKPISWITDNAIYAVSLPIDCNLIFLANVLRTAKLSESSKGGAQPFVNQDSLKECPIPLPSAEEQNEIVDRIHDTFSQIDALESWCATELTRSATLRQSILKSAFSGQLVPQDPADEPASELLARILSVRAVPKAIVQKSAALIRRGRRKKSSASEAA